jgi:Ca2+-transporting ATPase
MDGPPAMALGVDPARPDVMGRPPRRANERILSGSRLIRILRAGAIMALGTLGVLAYAQRQYADAVALTMAFTTFVLFQFFNALNARTEDRSVFTRYLFTNRPLWISLGAVVALQIAAVQLPLLQGIFDTQALSAAQWAICAGVATTILAIDETIKLARRGLERRHRKS